MQSKISDIALIEAIQEHGSIRSAVRALTGTENARLRKRATRLGIITDNHGGPQTAAPPLSSHPHRIEIHLSDGVVLIGSDAHIWPGKPSTAMRAFEEFCNPTGPLHRTPVDVICLNGDVFDGAKLSRFPSIGWEQKPTVAEELSAGKSQLSRLIGERRIWPLGNHDLRFETKIANVLPDYAGVEGVHLKDHFPDWEPCWSLWINPGYRPVCIKHRFKGGIHARHNNTLYAGVSIVTGHLHGLGVTPWSDYWGVRFGVDTGTLAVPYGPQFTNYTEDNPVNWRSGFVVLTFRDGRLLWPEIVHVLDEANGLVEFRGEIIRV